MKRVFICLGILFCLILSGCGGSSGSGNGGGGGTTPFTLTSGNWSLRASSQVTPGTVYIGGNLLHSGSSLSGIMHVANSSCFDVMTNINFSGTTTPNNSFSITSSAVDSQVITVTGTIGGPSGFSGSYTITGGCATGDHGTLNGIKVPSITGIR